MKPFYDCHFHVQNLTHPHLEAFIDRIRNDSKIAKLLLKPIDPVVLDIALLAAPIAGLFIIVSRIVTGITGQETGPTEAHLRILNLLVLMNRPIDEYFLAVDEEVSALMEKGFHIGDDQFDQIMLSALIMDYTDRDYRSNWTKTIPYAQARKPVVRQTEDLLAGMKRYRETLEAKGKEASLTVLPFLGINPENYGLEPESYVMLAAKLDQGDAPSIFSTAQGSPKAFYNPTSGRLDWRTSVLSVDDLTLLKNCIKQDQPQDKIALAKQQLDDLKKLVESQPVPEISLLVNLDENRLQGFREKYVYSAKPQGGIFSWKADHMTEQERKTLIDALAKPPEQEDRVREMNAYASSIGRIEYLFRSLENKDTLSIQQLLNQFFGSRQVTQEEVLANQKAWPGSIEKMSRGLFSGIKLYPPLGFDPNPGDDEHIHSNSRKKRMWYLYKFCEARQIPITVHTSNGGFQIMEKHLHFKFTSPARWKGVLRNFPNLRINFAHCAVEDAVMNNGLHEWKKILFEELMCARKQDGSWAYPNVYADVSDLLNTTKAYEQFEDGMTALNLDDEQWAHVEDRLLFGSDFMINLRESESYSDYISRFAMNKPQSHPANNANRKIQFKDDSFRYKMAVTNPTRFLFPFG